MKRNPQIPDHLLEAIRTEIQCFRRVRHERAVLFTDGLPLHPIPFFGNILSAEVITVALNPAQNEFTERSWPREMDPRALGYQLIDYFNLWEAPPHRFFERFGSVLSRLGCSYQSNVAHLDLLPYPTMYPNGFSTDQSSAWVELVLSDRGQHLKKWLRLCPAVKLALVMDFAVPAGPQGSIALFEWLANVGFSSLIEQSVLRRISDVEIHRDDLRKTSQTSKRPISEWLPS